MQTNASTHLATEADAPLAVPLDREYAPSGSGVVSHRNMVHVGYNGIKFRRLRACPELHNENDPLVRATWPLGLLKRSSSREVSEEPVQGSEQARCAPENWVVRRPASHFTSPRGEIGTRYPPRNMLNAKYKNPARHSASWEHTATYHEPSFPLIPETSAVSALRQLQECFPALEESVHVLHILRSVYKDMGDRQNITDPWLQQNVTVPSAEVLAKYREELSLYKEREKGHPSAAITVKQAFKKDPTVREKAETILRDTTASASSFSGTRSPQSTAKLLPKKLADLFEEAELIPGGLEKYECLVERDLERYSKELKYFREVTQRRFDEEHGLLPTPVPTATDSDETLASQDPQPSVHE